MNLILCDDDKAFLDKLEIRIRGLCQEHGIAVEMESYTSAKEMLEGIKNLDEISVFFIDIDMPEVNGFEVASYLKKWNRERCLPIRKHRGAREKRYSFGYAVFLILALMK